MARPHGPLEPPPLPAVAAAVAAKKAPTVDSLKAASKIVASSLGKPESYVQVVLKMDVPMVFGGTDEPTAACTLSSIGAIGGDKNKDISAAICAHLEEYYGIEPGRCARPPSRPRGSAPSSNLQTLPLSCQTQNSRKNEARFSCGRISAGMAHGSGTD